MASADSWELEQRLVALLGLDDAEAGQIIAHARSMRELEANEYLRNLLGDSQDASQFIAAFEKAKSQGAGDSMAPPPSKGVSDLKSPPSYQPQNGHSDQTVPAGTFSPPPMPSGTNAPPQRAQQQVPPKATKPHNHTNQVIKAAQIRARDEQEMQQMLQDLQYRYNIYNSDIEPEHESEYPCNCPIHQYQQAKWRRYGVQKMWSEAVMYPGEKAYDDNQFNASGGIFTRNPYRYGVVSPYGYFQAQSSWNRNIVSRPQPNSYTRSIHQTIELNNSLNRKAQASIEGKEPKHSIWADEPLHDAMSKISLSEKGAKRLSVSGTPAPAGPTSTAESRSSGFTKFRKAVGIKSSDEKAIDGAHKQVSKGSSLRDDIMAEEQGRWPDDEWRTIVMTYQAKVGMTEKIAELRSKSPIQYLHLLRAGYFEPIPVAWADQASNPLKFSIEAAAGWRGITPAWRGYEDTAEERLYWVLNHRINPDGATLTRLKPDFISEMDMARARMAKAVEPPPLYFAADDVCHVQHTSEGYSRQVLPPPFRPYDRPETQADDTMILLDVSGSMDFAPVRPVYNQYLITSYQRGTQPKNKDVAKSIIRRFTDAMANHHHTRNEGYDLVTFANHASYIGNITHRNLEHMWRNVRLGGGTRVMTGWQKVKELHFKKHSESATFHPVYGWQAGLETPMLRLLLLLDGEATDMDEFELDLLSLSWAHVTIFLIGVDGCPHHHRHANELQRISDVNHHVNFVDAQGNCPERYVTHELLKRHLGYDISMSEFQEMEVLPPYSE